MRVNKITPIFKILYPIEYRKNISIPSGRSIVGRGISANIRLEDPLVSRTHFEVFFQNDQVFIKDAHSKNGTFVNNTEIQETLLKDGDSVQIGSTILKFSFNDITTTERTQIILPSFMAFEDFRNHVQNILIFLEKNKLPFGIIYFEISLSETAKAIAENISKKIAESISKEKRTFDFLTSKTPLQYFLFLSNISEEELLKEKIKLESLIAEHQFSFADTQIRIHLESSCSHFEKMHGTSLDVLLEQIKNLCKTPN